jgi:hypothetical protein
MPYDRARALALAVRSLDASLSSSILDAIGNNDAALTVVLADRALEVLSARREAERRIATEVAARVEQRRAAFATVAVDEEQAIEAAAQALTNAAMVGSRESYRRQVSHGRSHTPEVAQAGERTEEQARDRLDRR